MKKRAKLIDWGVKEVSTGSLALNLKFEDLDESKHYYGTFFLLKKDGSPNQKTLDTMGVLGFNYKKPSEIPKADAFDTSKEVDITLETNDEGYTNVEWVNNPGEVPGAANLMDSEQAVKKLRGFDAMLSGEIIKTKENHEDDIKASNDQEIPF